MPKDAASAGEVRLDPIGEFCDMISVFAFVMAIEIMLKFSFGLDVDDFLGVPDNKKSVTITYEEIEKEIK